MSFPPNGIIWEQRCLNIRHATIATSSISLFSSALIIIVYTYMIVHHREKANRVSLRCVFLCCLSNVINVIPYLVMALIRGDNPFCTPAGVIVQFTNILSATLLTLVGINLLLVFVINVPRKNLLERFYYPTALVYSIGSIILPAYTVITDPSQFEEQLNCWFMYDIAYRQFETIAWTYFNAFMGFVNIIAIICAISAMIKLHREKSKIANIRSSNIETFSTIEDTGQSQINNGYSKVIFRCILYPLVPFLANIFGLILQLIIITEREDTSHYELAMTNTVFSGLEGFFVAVVFFTDPAVKFFGTQLYQEYHQKYVEEFIMVSKKEQLLPIENTTYFTFNSVLDTPMSSSSQSYNQGSHYRLRQSASMNSHLSNNKAIPMRKINVTAPNSDSKHQEHPISDIPPAYIRDGSSPQQEVINTETNVVYNIPYKCPRIAICIHFIMNWFDARKKTQEEQEAPKRSRNGSSNIRPPSDRLDDSNSTAIVINDSNSRKYEENQITTTEYCRTSPTHVNTENF